MKNNNKVALLLAGALLVASAIFSQILDKNTGQVLVLGLSGLFFSIIAFTRQGRKQIVCEVHMIKKRPFKILGIMLGVVVVFGGIGFLFGQLLYHILN
ncbi:hypothetical protein MTsPCn9_27300 [Croceitalea sp. MTPC9]|uniref:hypothetical protein n=1 Tax=unclassified Croceitalea TaxID=2632280 RepID=UPI002B3A4CB7|nr:hypothetical protein MTsPCn6_22880 [Croceitalea sp. MTPC6]GMN17792.1 hypothetical protein MTsPCn9_27300 [Croceitalea sp. MTPC9]